VTIRAHRWWALIWFCVPVTLAITRLVRAVAAEVAANLPGVWRDYRVLATSRHRWFVTAGCAWLSAVTHRLWDMVTHASIDQGAIHFAWLSDTAVAGQPWWRVLHYGSTMFGAVAVAWCVVDVGRRGLLLRWHPPVTDALAPRPRRFWTAAVIVWAVGVAVQPILAGWTQTQILFVRLLAIFALGLVAGAITVRTSGPDAPAPTGTSRSLRVSRTR